ncbi:hypothetical protein HDU91_000134, partial [Kappamyces sp. JEL0680]
MANPLAQLGLGGTKTDRRVNHLRKEQERMEMEEKRGRPAEEHEAVSLPAEHPLMAPVLAAEHYLEHLKKQTSRAWYQNISPAAVRRFLETSFYAR